MRMIRLRMDVIDADSSVKRSAKFVEEVGVCHAMVNVVIIWMK